MSDRYDWHQEDKALALHFRDRERKVEEPGSKKGTGPYKVRFGGLYSTCTCPSFVYRQQAKGLWCKHIKKWQDILDASERGDELARTMILEQTQPFYLEEKDPSTPPW